MRFRTLLIIFSIFLVLFLALIGTRYGLFSKMQRFLPVNRATHFESDSATVPALKGETFEQNLRRCLGEIETHDADIRKRSVTGKIPHWNFMHQFRAVIL